jgi:hypothetical protein
MAGKKATADLIAEITALREEVKRLREAQASHICYHYTPIPWQPQPSYPPPIWSSLPYTVTSGSTSTLQLTTGAGN